MIKAIRRGLVLLIAAIWEALNHWHFLDFVVAKLRSEGPVGMFLAELITSETFRFLLIVTGFLIVLRGYIDDRKRSAQPVVMSPLPASLLPDVRPVIPETTSLQPVSISEQRIFVGSEITVNYLNSLREGRTGVQAQALINLYIGKWMRVSGRLGNVLSSGRNRCQVTLEYNPLKFTDLFMMFSEEWRDHLSILTLGQNIAVVGKIEQVDYFGVHLTDCELVDP
jgi:hypothetical protein